MKRNQTKRGIAGVMVLALLVFTIAGVSAGCGQSVSGMATVPSGTASTVTTIVPEEWASSLSHIPELVPESSTAVLEIQTGPFPESSHNLLEY